MIILHDITVKRGEKTILKNISATVGFGDFIVLVGSNGAGKTTLFEVISGKLRPDSGFIRIENKKELVEKKNKPGSLKISRLLQNPESACILDATVRENLILALLRDKPARLVMPNHDALSSIADLLALFNVDSLILEKKMKDLSGGQKQQIVFIMALAPGIPDVLLLDEPTASLDPQTATALFKIVLSYIRNHRITTVMITHDPELAIALATHIWVIEEGSLVAQYNLVLQKDVITPHMLVGSIPYNSLRN